MSPIHSVLAWWNLANAAGQPVSWQPVPTDKMETDPCRTGGFRKGVLALSSCKNFSLSACGGHVSLHSVAARKLLQKLQPPPPAATALDLHPQDENVAALGLEDGQVLLYDLRIPRVVGHLHSHTAQVTGVRFTAGGSLVCAGADSSLVMHVAAAAGAGGAQRYETGWVARLEPSGFGTPPPACGEEVHISVQPSENNFASAHPAQLAIYNCQLGQRLAVWAPSTRSLLGAPITAATHSPIGTELLVAFRDGAVGIFNALNLQLNCRIAPHVLDAQGRRSYALAVAAACDANNCVKLALGLVDGSVQVWEPRGASAVPRAAPTAA